MRITPYLFFACLVFSCTSGEPETMEVIIDIDPEFQSYVDEFIDEAAKRGQNIDFSDTGLSVKFSEFDLERANGRCFFQEYRIEIDKADWFSFSPSFRSYLLFHELGHCELRRGHINSKFDDQSWRSIMKGDPFNGIDIRNPVPYFGFRREYYINELFNDNISQPEWATRNFSYNTTLDLENIESITDQSRINSRPGMSIPNYEIEIDFDLRNTEGTITSFEWGVSGSNYFIEVYPGFGFYVGVKDGGQNNFLHYSNNINLFNGSEISKITIRNHDNFEQIFINEEQFFILDPQENLDFVTFDATRGGQRVDTNIRSFRIEGIN